MKKTKTIILIIILILTIISAYYLSTTFSEEDTSRLEGQLSITEDEKDGVCNNPNDFADPDCQELFGEDSDCEDDCDDDEEEPTNTGEEDEEEEDEEGNDNGKSKGWVREKVEWIIESCSPGLDLSDGKKIIKMNCSF